MPEKTLTGIELFNNSGSTVVLSSLTEDSINMLRTNTGGTDGDIYFNGKQYFTMKSVSPHLLKNNTSVPLPTQKINYVFDNIGWRGVTINLTVTASEGGPVLRNVVVIASYDGSQVQYTCTEGVARTIQIPTYCDYTLTFEDKYGFVTPQPISGKGGREIVTSYTANYIGEADLSLISPLDGSVMEMRETANCYIIHDEGIYDIPLIYGAAIVDNEVRRMSFTQNDQYMSTTAPFYNGMGDKITDFRIDYDTNIFDVGIAILLADSEDFIIGNEYDIIPKVIDTNEGEYEINCIRINCTSIPEYGGNITLGLMNNNTHEVLWSWHLWAHPNPIELVPRVSIEGVTYETFTVNLGWVWDDEEHTFGSAPYYQWGRKDPMLRYGVDAAQGTEYLIDTEAAPYMYVSIMNPNTFYCGGSSGGLWWTDKDKGVVPFRNYWDYERYDDTMTTSYTNKTIYDPCPRGFFVPSADFFNGLEISEGQDFDMGYTLDDRFYHAMGYLFFDDGKAANVYTHGYYWTTWSSTSNTTGEAFVLEDGQLTIFADGANSFATQIVPVRVTGD